MTRSSSPLAVRFAAWLSFILISAFAWPAMADPPARAARISYVSSSASFSPSGSDEWLQARVNRPVWIGDRLWSGDGRVELQLGGASLRLAPRTLVRVLNFDDRIAQFELTEGSAALHVRALDSDDSIEIDTPTFAFVTREEGDYRIDVESDRTAVSAIRGYGDVYGSRVAYRIDGREQFVFYDQDLRDYDVAAIPRGDAFDRWAIERASREDRSPSARYVNADLVGYVDLDTYGEWRSDPDYGNVWVPRVAADWAPYRYGHWSWIDPWGWTWIDDAPWGYAPSHYGRWALLGRTWAWVPGPRTVRPVYSPALVAWVGGENFSLSVGSGRSRGVAWFPLAPGEVWRPPYEVSREYFTRVNVSNTVVNQTQVINVYESRNAARHDVNYRYRQAVTAVPVEAVVRGRPVQQNVVQVNNNVVVNATVIAAPVAQPTIQSFIGSAPRSQARPPAESTRRPVIARTAPPAAVPTLQERVAIIQTQQGRPVDRAALDRAAPQVQGAPAPGATHVLPPTQAPAGQPPVAAAERVAPNQLRSNVRVVETPQATPKPPPPPPENTRGRDARAPGGNPRSAQPGAAPVAPTAPQSASQPATPPTDAPRGQGATQPGDVAGRGPGAPTAQPPRADTGPGKGRDADRAPPGQAERGRDARGAPVPPTSAPAVAVPPAAPVTPPSAAPAPPVQPGPPASAPGVRPGADTPAPPVPGAASGAPGKGRDNDRSPPGGDRQREAAPAATAPAAPVAPKPAPPSAERARPGEPDGTPGKGPAAQRAPAGGAPAAAAGPREEPRRATPPPGQPSPPAAATPPAPTPRTADAPRAPAGGPPAGARPEGPRAASPAPAAGAGSPPAAAAPKGQGNGKGDARRDRDDEQDAPGKGKGKDRDDRGK